jgi:chromate transporter
MTIHLGYLRAGWPGLIAGGLSFILPAMLIVLSLSWAYVRYGSTPAAGWLLYGIKPVVLALVACALWELGRKAIHSAPTAVAGLAALALALAGVNEIVLLVVGGVTVLLVQAARERRTHPGAWLPLLPLGFSAAVVPAFSLPVLFLTCLKIGAVLYGSGYVLLAFLRADFVTRLGWLTDQQLLDAIAVGQVTPGPLFTSVTFIGYLLAGVPGALLATLGMFLPSFVFVALTHPLVARLRQSRRLSAMLDGVIAASLGLMAAVTAQLARASLVDPPTLILFALAVLAILRLRINPTWLVFGGAAAGLAIRWLGA